jgi:hypothetical protein
MEAIRSSETSVLIRATRRHLPEDDNQLEEAYAVELKHQCQSLKSINLYEGPYLSLLDVTYYSLIEAHQYEECFFVFFRNPFLFGESGPEFLHAQGILTTLDIPTSTTEAVSLTVIDVCSSKAKLCARFFGVMFTFTFAKNYRRVQNKRPFAIDTSCQLMKRQTFPSEPVRTGLQTGSHLSRVRFQRNRR